MTTQDHRPPGKALPTLWSEAEDERRPEAGPALPPEVDPADVRTVRQAFHLTLAQLAAIFGLGTGGTRHW
jgi:hypothetical protein